jgi:hypothetical protein
MQVEDAVAAALLVILSGALSLLAAAAFRRYRNRSFLFLTAAFVIALAEGAVISLLVLGVVPGTSLPLFLVAGIQVAILLLIYVATFPRE